MNRGLGRRVGVVASAGAVLVLAVATGGASAQAVSSGPTPAPDDWTKLSQPFVMGERLAEQAQGEQAQGQDQGERGAAGGSTASARVSACPGAPIPAGYGVAGSMPYSTRTPTGKKYNPQGIVLFMLDTWANKSASKSQRLCLIQWAAKALNAGSSTRTFRDGDGHQRVARLYPYPYAFSANPSLPALRSGWVSGLAQGSVLTAMSYLHDDTGNDDYLRIAEETFNSFLLPYSSGGFVTQTKGLTYLQEYVTTVPAHVLNGHNEAVGALIVWAKRTGDPKALDLARKALLAIHTTAPLGEISFPTGLATSYDLLRGWPAAPLRAAPAGKGLTVHAARVVGSDGKDHGAARLPVQRAAGPGRNLLVNAGFSAWSRGRPTGWSVDGAGAAGNVRRGSDPRSVRIRSTGRAHVVVRQDLARVRVATRLSVAWTARLARTRGVDSTPGDVVLQSVCGRRVTTLAAADVRSPIRAQEAIAGVVPAGCVPRVKLYQADGAAPSDVTFADVTVRVADPLGAARAPAYPISVLDVPSVSLKVTYTGSGWLQAWVGGRWTTIGWLGDGRRRTTTLVIPAYVQGRTVNLRYHNSHIAELTALYELTGDTVLRDRALAWLPYAPAMEHLRGRLGAKVAPNPDYADLFTKK